MFRARYSHVTDARGWLLAATLAGTVILASSPAHATEPVTLTVGADFVDLRTHIPHEQSVLRVAGPDGYALILHLPEEFTAIEADLLRDAGGGWSRLPVGRYHYEVVLYADGRAVGRSDGVFLVEDDGRASAPALSLPSPTKAVAGRWERIAPLDTPASLYVGLGTACSLFAEHWWFAGEERAITVREQCGIAEDAVAVLLELRAQPLEERLPRVTVWAGDLPEPAEAVLDGGVGPALPERRASTVVNLCTDIGCDGTELRMRSTELARLEARVVGYFRPLGVNEAGDMAALIGGVPLQPLAFESDNNNFFGDGAGASIEPDAERNSFFGAGAGASNTSASDNSFFGYGAGYNNITGEGNSFFGSFSGVNNTTGSWNSFFGYPAGPANTTGENNSFFGAFAGRENTEGSHNAFFGRSAGRFNTTGDMNAFFGAFSGEQNTEGRHNTFIGRSAGRQNTTANNNTFSGSHAGEKNTTGSGNAFLGNFAGS